MTSKRMSISALLSSDSTPAKHSESSNPQQLGQYQSYHPEIESVHDSVSKRSGGSPSVQTHFSQSHPKFPNSITSSTFYQPSDNNRTSPIISDPRSVQWPSHGYPRVAERIQYHSQEEEPNSYYHSSSPSYGYRIPERERPALSRPSSAHMQIQTSHPEHSPLHSTPRPHSSEFRERDNWRFPAPSSSINPSTDTGDSLLSVLTRTAASEAAAGPGQSRNTSNVNFPGSHSLRPPSTLRRDRNKEVERDRNRPEREREHEMQAHVQMPHDYQRSPFIHSEVPNPSYHYHPDTSQSPDMHVLRTRPGSHGSTSTVHPPPSIHYTPSSRSPSRSQQQPVYNSPSNVHYHQTIPPETPSQPLSHSHHSQHRPHIDNPSTRVSSSTVPSARSVPMPPRLGLTLPLSLSPATMSGQLVSPISPQNPSRGSVTGVKTQMQSRSAQYPQVISPIPRSPVIAQVNERSAAPGLPGKASNPAVLQSLRTPVPQPMPLHRLSIPHTSSMSHMTSPPHSVSFPSSSGPFSPQQQQAFRRVPNPDTRERDARPTRNQVTYHTGDNPDMEAPKRNVERNNVVSRTPIVYDQRRTTESRPETAEVVSEKARPTNDLTSQEKRTSSLDKGFRLWNNGPIIEDTTHSQRMDVEVRHPSVQTEMKPNEYQDFSSRIHFSRQEDSLTRYSILPLGTLPVPSIERSQTVNPYVRAGAEQGPFSQASNQHKGGRNRAMFTEDLREGAPHQQPETSPLPNSSPTNLNSKLQLWHHPNPYPDEQHSSSARDSARVVPPESHETLPVVQSPVAGSALKPLSLEVETDDKLPSRTSGKDMSFNHPRSPSVLPNPSSRSPHLSATDTISSGKNSEIEAHDPSPPALSGDAPLLYDSVQYPLPSPVQDMVLPEEERKESHKEPDHTHGDNETIRHRPSAESASPAFTPPVPPSIQVPTIEVNFDLHKANDTVPLVRPKEVDEPQPEAIVEEQLSHGPSYFEPNVDDDQSKKELLIEIVDVSMRDVDSQSVPLLVDDPSLQLLNEDIAHKHVQSVESPFPSRTSVSAPSPIRDSLPLTVDNQNNNLKPFEEIAVLRDENMVNNGGESIQELENGSGVDSSILVLHQPPEELHEKERAISPKLETSPTAIDLDVAPVSAATPNEGDPTEDPNALVEPSNDGFLPSEDIDENIVKVDATDVSLDVQEATHPPPDGRSWEEELLSLVDDVDLKLVPDVKPKIMSEVPHSPVGPTSSLAVPSNVSSRKGPGSGTSVKTKTQKSRGQSKPLKSKNSRTDSETITPSSPTSGNTPTSRPASKPSARTKKGFPGSRKKTVTMISTARSSSAIPEPAPETMPAPLEERLYCLCSRPYDEEKVMIACDRCDEWYHPRCVNMPEQEIDLVDQFICDKCMERYPGSKTTYKTRCHRGTNHISDYDENPPCWKTVKGAFSKYCSDTCGIAHMKAKIARSGKSPNQLWPLVRHAKKREGVTVEYLYDGSNASKRMKLGNGDVIEVNEKKRAQVYLNGILTESPNIKVHTSTNGDRTRLAVLKQRIAAIRSSKNRCKLELEYVTTRRRLLDLAVERASEKFCGWDTRLEMGDHEWATWIVSLQGKGALYGNQDHPDSDDSAEGDMSWLCQGPVECPRHHGWKTVRDLELQMEVDSKNGSIKQFLETERELRSKIEEMDDTTTHSVRKIKKTLE